MKNVREIRKMIQIGRKERKGLVVFERQMKEVEIMHESTQKRRKISTYTIFDDIWVG